MPETTMAAGQQDRGLRERLPKVRGRLVFDAPLARHTWFRVGGPAGALFQPADMDDLAAFLAAKPADIPMLVIGIGANLLVRDGGVPGVVIRLGRPFAGIGLDGLTVSAGAMALDYNVAKACQAAGIGGMAFLSGIPGTVGGGLRMNAGAYGRCFADIVTEIRAIGAGGQSMTLSPAAWAPVYRGCGLADDLVLVGASFRGEAAEPAAIAARMAAIRTAREASQPIRSRTGGSTFRNPPGEKAWVLIDRAGCRGMQCGGAMVSRQHCNFLINTGTATAADIETLGEAVRYRVLETTGHALAWEIRRVGQPGDKPGGRP